MDDATFNTLLIISANTLITYFLLKRLESRLGKENFEFQTRFADVYSKRVKALEKVVQKFFALENTLERLAKSTIRQILLDAENSHNDYESECEDVGVKFNDLKDFYQSNRLFFPEYVNNKVTDILSKVDGISVVVMIIGSKPRLKEVPDVLRDYLPKLPTNYYPNEPKELLAYLSVWIAQLSKELEELYKSEAGLKP